MAKRARALAGVWPAQLEGCLVKRRKRPHSSLVGKPAKGRERKLELILGSMKRTISCEVERPIGALVKFAQLARLSQLEGQT